MTEASERGYLSGFAEYELVELPLAHGQVGRFGSSTEQVQVRNVPNHIATKVEQSIEAETSIRYKNHKDASEVFGHWVGTLQGLQLVDKSTSKGLDHLLAQFSNVAKGDRKQFVREKTSAVFERPAARQTSMSPEEFTHVAERQGRITAEIFRLREQIDLHLQAGDIDTVTKLLSLISVLDSERAKRIRGERLRVLDSELACRQQELAQYRADGHEEKTLAIDQEILVLRNKIEKLRR